MFDDFDHTAKASVGDALTRVSAAVSPGIAKKLYFASLLKLFSSPMIDDGSVQLTTWPETKPGRRGDVVVRLGARREAAGVLHVDDALQRAAATSGVPANVVLPVMRLRFQPGSLASTWLVARTVAKSDAFCADAPARLRKYLPFDLAVRHAARNCARRLRHLDPEVGHDRRCGT